MTAEPSLPKAPKYSVIIPHKNDVARLEKCLHALLRSGNSASPDLLGECEFIVADNGSTEDVSGLACAFPEVKFVVESSPGAAMARNRGVAASRGQLLLFIDADCIPGPRWLDRAAEAASSYEIAGGAVETFDETPPPRSGAQAFEAVFAFRQRQYIERQGFSVTANLMTSRAVFDKVGPFRSVVSEDLEWCHRARSMGYSVKYVENVTVMHPTRASWHALTRKWRRLTSEIYAHYRLSGGSNARWLVRALLVLWSPAVDVGKVITSPRLHGPVERLRAGVTLFRIRWLRAWWMLGQLAADASAGATS